ncbi:helix-turn-helix transcriptional regulator (plasmid) [Photobacterium sp. DA100]|uniref:helix-turn-helix transcriptional regulator n=1 Tax=Photobacterium sp. DA100 TaxID=3027472 RepID=UPI00247AD317|nr:helix-turn-helix transcriptional regulator [Photobacterium sp. DA100]WEM45520.1 helix-turn-helix transcriptional regulator [Photobacterium sp. DA100]
MNNKISFCRSGIFRVLLKAVERQYPGTLNKIDLPDVIFENPMRLIPLPEISRYFNKLAEKTEDKLFIVHCGPHISLHDCNHLNYLIASSNDLFTAIMRFNAVLSTFQSNSEAFMIRSGSINKWRYNDISFRDKDRLFDGIIAMWFFIQLLRTFHGKEYLPRRILLPGNQIGKDGEVENFIGCSIDWNQKETQVWFTYDELVKRKSYVQQQLFGSKLDHQEILSYIDMPLSNDFLRCIYEVINYSKDFGFPKLENVAKLINLSPQQLQRRLKKEHLSFTELVNHQLLCNQAPRLLSKYSISEVSRMLGYQSEQSFTKAFRRMHKLTPRQYINELIERW